MSKSKGSVVLTRREALFLSPPPGWARREQTCVCLRQHQDRSSPGTGQCLDAALGGGEDAIRQSARICRWRRFHLQRRSLWSTTAGENRWLPAKPPEPWTDEYPALVYGANCPQNLHHLDRASSKRSSRTGTTAGRAKTC